MSRLKKFAKKSDLMNVKIAVGKEKFNFNLFKEIVIDEDQLSKDIKDQPSAYAFLTMLHAKLVKHKKQIETDKDRAFSIAFVRYKKMIDGNTQRPHSKELAKERANIDPRVKKAEDKLLKASYELDVIGACVTAFEQRASLMQTLSANVRSQKT